MYTCCTNIQAYCSWFYVSQKTLPCGQDQAGKSRHWWHLASSTGRQLSSSSAPRGQSRRRATGRRPANFPPVSLYLRSCRVLCLLKQKPILVTASDKLFYSEKTFCYCTIPAFGARTTTDSHKPRELSTALLKKVRPLRLHVHIFKHLDWFLAYVSVMFWNREDSAKTARSIAHLLLVPSSWREKTSD